MIKHKLILYLFSSFMLLMVACSWMVRLDDSVFNFNKSFKSKVRVMMPQGWRFFTKSPKDGNLKIIKVDDSNQTILHSMASSNNMYGLSRKSRRLGFEFSMVLGQLSTSNVKWKKINGTNIPPLDSLNAYEVFNELPFIKNIKDGKYLAYYDYQIPYSWRNSFDSKNRNREYIVIDYVNCSQL